MAIVPEKYHDLQYFRAEGIAVPHAFTTRRGGVSSGALEGLNLGAHRGDEPENVAQNYRILAQALDFDLTRVVLTHQVHSDIVRCVTAHDAQGLDHGLYPACDALITIDAGVTLVVFTADCTPILLYDTRSGAVGAVHAGWRGTAADIVGKTVHAMREAFGSRAEDLHAAIGPNIGACCFETDADVPNALYAAFGSDIAPFITRSGEKYFPDLKKINAFALRRAGVERIEMSELCTACRADLFWSQRRTGALRGSQGALIRCKGGNV